MPSFTLSTPVASSVRVAQVSGMFDTPFEGRVASTIAFQTPPLDAPWSIAAVVGPSGVGKTSVARRLFPESPATFETSWPRDQAMLDAFPPMPIKSLLRLFAAVGLNSPPSWIKPFHVLSCGEQFRAGLAREIAEAIAARRERPLLVIDEFTSSVDRLTARSVSTSLAKAIRRKALEIRLVAVTCHDDVLAWLAPDWTLDMTTGEVSTTVPRPARVRLKIEQVPQSAWRAFARHHYLRGELSRAATCYVARWQGRPVGFCATIGIWGRPGSKRITRIVVVPEAQGLGIGMRLAEQVCELEVAGGFMCSIRASHPAVLAHCRNSPRWQATAIHKVSKSTVQQRWGKTIRTSNDRLTATFVYKTAQNP